MPPKRKATAAPAAKKAAPAKKAKAAPAKKAPAAKGKAPAAKKAKAPPKPTGLQVEFTEKLLEVCKILMTVCETVIVEDPNELTVTTENNYKIHGEALLQLLPEAARMQMMKIAEAYQQELEADPPFDLFDDDDDGAALVGTSGSAAGVDDDDDDFMIAEHFFHFKQFFTEKEAAAFVKKVDKAIDEAMKSLMTDCEAEEDEEEEDDDDFMDELSDDDDWTDANVPWKGQKK